MPVKVLVQVLDNQKVKVADGASNLKVESEVVAAVAFPAANQQFIGVDVTREKHSSTSTRVDQK